MGRGARRTTAVAVLVVGTAVGVLRADDGPAGSGDDAGVRVRLAAGTTVAYTSTIEWRISQKAGRKRHGSEGVTHQDLELTATEAAGDGAVRVAIRFGRAWGRHDATTRPRVDFDTALAPLTPEEARAPVAAPVHAGSSVTATLRRDGTFQELADLVATQADVVSPTPDRDAYSAFCGAYGAAQPLRELALLLPSLPARPMPAGTFFEDDGLFGAPGWFQYVIHRRNELARRGDALAVIKSTGRVRDLTAPPRSAGRRDDRRRSAEMSEGTYTCVASVRRADGLPDDVTAHLSLVLDVDFGSDGKGSQTDEWTLSLQRREPAAAEPAAVETAPPHDAEK